MQREGLAIGFFDGVHLGHRRILAEAAAAITFVRHPLSVLCPGRAPRLLMRPGDRIAAIRAQGIAEVTALEFTPAMAALSPDEFIARHLSGVRKLYCGANWRFGHGGAGDAEYLRRRGFEVIVRDYAEYRGERISSTRIRGALAAGEIEAVTAMLGRPWRLAGEIVPGKGKGREIGYPTVNVRPPADADRELALPPKGVYAVRAGGTFGIANFGLAPTAGADAWKTPVLEIHFPKPAAAPRLPPAAEVEFLRYLRPEMKFESFAALRERIALDVAEFSRWLATGGY